jgi:hypothetical protein
MPRIITLEITSVEHSQFKKFNLSETFGIKVEITSLEASVIYDKATDVGYPALPMDVSLAEALIGSLKYQYHPLGKTLKNWETKIYYNHITHRMDDTKRPAVLFTWTCQDGVPPMAIIQNSILISTHKLLINLMDI